MKNMNVASPPANHNDLLDFLASPDPPTQVKVWLVASSLVVITIVIINMAIIRKYQHPSRAESRVQEESQSHTFSESPPIVSPPNSILPPAANTPTKTECNQTSIKFLELNITVGSHNTTDKTK